MTDDLEENDGPKTGRSLSELNSVTSRFVDRADLTALVLSDATIEDVSAQQSFLSSTLFRDCTFRRCNFRRADFEGAVFESCLFDECDFSVADLRSVDAARTRFINCTFEGGSTRSCRFIDCFFERCRLTSHSFEENKIETSVLSDCLFERSTVLHCEFVRTQLERTDLTDCTSQFHLFEDCSFVKSSINAEALGLTFGLTIKNLRDLRLVWRGQGLESDDTDNLPADLVTTYIFRGWHFAAAILKLNFGLESRPLGLKEAFESIETTAKSPLPVKTDEVRFLAGVVEHLSKKGKLPFVSIVTGLDIITTLTEARGERDNVALKLLFHALKDAEHTNLAALDEKISPLLSVGTESEWLAVTFDEKPQTSFRHWLEDLHSGGLVRGPAPRFRKAVSGSYLEVFSMTAGCLAGVLICLTLVERIVDRLIWIRARSAILASEKLPAFVRHRALQPISLSAGIITKELQSCLDRAAGPKGEEFIAQAQGFAERLMKIEIGNESHTI
jgi:fluoroquinolone resistance protein